jgi:methionine-rich copper-binding protein CopC
MPSHPAPSKGGPAVPTPRRLAVATAVALLGLLVLPATAASAHASLVRADPAAGSTLTKAPTAVSLTFDDAVTRGDIVVTGADGARADIGAAHVLGTILTVPVHLRAPGRYAVAYRVVSDDGHPVTGTLSFAFVPPGAVVPAGASGAVTSSSTGNGALARTLGVVGAALFVTLLLGVGLVRALRANRAAAARAGGPAATARAKTGTTIDVRRPRVVEQRRERP